MGLLAVLFAASLALGLVSSGASPAGAASRWGKDYLPNFEILDQDGNARKFYDDLIKGKTVVLSFVYTSCQNICPLALARLAEVQDRLGDIVGRDVHFISVSIDPIPDTPERLKEQAKVFGAGPGWTFVTGDPDRIDEIRHKLGERSGKDIALHKNEVLMYNDRTGEWNRSSAFADLGVLAFEIRNMDPAADTAASKAEIGKDAATVRSETAHELPGQALFVKACAACHTIGGGTKVGPDLVDLTKRRARPWLEKFLAGPEKMRAAKDPIALQLQEQFPVVRMPNLSLSEDDIADVISYVEARNATRAAASEPGKSHH